MRLIDNESCGPLLTVLLALLMLSVALPAVADIRLSVPGVVQGEHWALYDFSSIRNRSHCLAYENIGYSLTIEDTDAVSRRVRVRCTTDDLGCGSPFPVDPGRWPESVAAYGLADAVSELQQQARSLTDDCRTQYQAVNKVLCWVSSSVEYSGEADVLTAPLAVLNGRQANCVGAAELAVALLRQSGIPARSVRGYLAPVGDIDAARPQTTREKSLGEEGLHRWIEIYYPGIGWVFSDPFRSINHVGPRYLVFDLEAPPVDGAIAPARFLGLRPEMSESVSTFVQLLDSGGALMHTDVVPALFSRDGLTLRRNRPVQYRPAILGLVFRTPDCLIPAPDTVRLVSDHLEREVSLREGLFWFTDIDQGEYRLVFLRNGRTVAQRKAVARLSRRPGELLRFELGQ